MSTPSFICLDLETTGLEVDTCCILEVGIVVADENLQMVAAESWMVKPSTDLSEMDDFVRDMHTKNGLLADLENSNPFFSAHVVGALVLGWLDSLELEPGKFPMFGSSIGFDRTFLKKYMPNLEEWFHYRNIDISTVKELARTWRPDLKWKPQGSKAHRSVDDCLATLDEARYYKNEIFTPLG
jgi:oligoribonuclease